MAELRKALALVAEDQVVDERPRLRVEEAALSCLLRQRVVVNVEELTERDEFCWRR